MRGTPARADLSTSSDFSDADDVIRSIPKDGPTQFPQPCDAPVGLHNAAYLASAYAQLGQLDAAWACVGDALTTVGKTKERFWEAEVHRVGGEIALISNDPDAAKAEAYFDRALAVARQQQAKSWELRASMSLLASGATRALVQQARELLAPVYGWFTEGFDTRDLKEAKALLQELAA